MKYFQQIGANMDFFPLLHAIQIKPELWDKNTLRTKHPGTAHSQVSDIWLWFNEMPKEGEESTVIDDKEVVAYPAWYALPQAHAIIFDLMRRVGAKRLGRVIITKLPAGKAITPHVDGGAPATYYQRYQIALQSHEGAVFNIGDESANFLTGDTWWINNEVEHSVENHSHEDRIVMIIDLRV